MTLDVFRIYTPKYARISVYTSIFHH